MNATVKDLLEQEAVLTQTLGSARQQADDNERLLLTSQGDQLVATVITCLRALGFGVRNMDAELPQNDRREDIRVTDPEVADWIAIAEVRGYTGGGQVLDLLRLGRFERRFHTDEGRPPSASWYIVNQFKDSDPATRDVLLAANPNELRTFAEGNGLAVDTRDLFRLWVDLLAGRLTQPDARALLRQVSGSFTYPAER